MERKMNLHSLRKQLDKKLGNLKAFISKSGPHIPQSGWIRTIRQCYSMSISQLARRNGVVYSRIAKAEKAEPMGAITLNSLHKIAHSLNCELYYAFVPRKPMEEYMIEEARLKAKSHMDVISHTMALELQDISENERERIIEEVLMRYLQRPNRIWD